MADDLVIVVDQFGDRWVRFVGSPSPLFNNYDQDDEPQPIGALLPHHVTTPRPLATSISPWSA